MYKILFVCSSNVCRSPYCEYTFKKLVEANYLLNGKIEVKSAGVVNKSKEIFPKAIPAIEKEGYSRKDVIEFKPSYIYQDYQRFKDADIIIGMSRMHRFFMPPTLWKKYHTLSKIATGKYKNIPDPFLAKTQKKYDECMKVIRGYLVEYANKLSKRKDIK